MAKSHCHARLWKRFQAGPEQTRRFQEAVDLRNALPIQMSAVEVARLLGIRKQTVYLTEISALCKLMHALKAELGRLPAHEQKALRK